MTVPGLGLIIGRITWAGAANILCPVLATPADTIQEQWPELNCHVPTARSRMLSLESILRQGIIKRAGAILAAALLLLSFGWSYNQLWQGNCAPVWFGLAVSYLTALLNGWILQPCIQMLEEKLLILVTEMEGSDQQGYPFDPSAGKNTRTPSFSSTK